MTQKSPSDTWIVLICQHEVLREPNWWVKGWYSSRLSAEKKYNQLLSRGISPNNLKIFHEV